MTDDARIFATADCTVYNRVLCSCVEGDIAYLSWYQQGCSLQKKPYSAYMIIHNAYMHAWRYPCTLHKTMKSGLIINPHQQISLSANIGTVRVSKLFFNNTIRKSEEVVFSFSWCPLKESSSGGECLDLDHHCTDGFRFKGWKTNIDFSNEVLCQISMLQRIGHSFVRND